MTIIYFISLYTNNEMNKDCTDMMMISNAAHGSCRLTVPFFQIHIIIHNYNLNLDK